MLNKIFPTSFDNNYRGRLIAIWFLIPITLMKLVIGFNISGFNPFVSPANILETVDKVPLSQLSAIAVENILFSSMAWGLTMLIFGLISTIILIRYRGMIQFMYLVFIFEQFGRQYISFKLSTAPLQKADLFSPAALINWTFAALLIIGFILSIWQKRGSP